MRNQPMLLNKGQYYQLVKYLSPDEVATEIKEKLDYIVEYLTIDNEKTE